MFIGRKDYLNDLESLWRKRTSSIVACRGRRRIGKSTLFREFAKRTADVYMEVEGLAPNRERPVTNEDQLNEFADPDADELERRHGPTVREPDRQQCDGGFFAAVVSGRKLLGI